MPTKPTAPRSMVQSIVRLLCRLGHHKWGTLRQLYLWQVANKINLRRDHLDDFKHYPLVLKDRLCVRCGKRDNQIEKVVEQYEAFCEEADELRRVAESFGEGRFRAI